MSNNRWTRGALIAALFFATGALAAPTVYPTGVTINDTGVADGYVLFGARDGLIHLIDVNGNDVHTWSIPCGFSYTQRPLAGGHVLTASCGDVVELDWDGTVVWQYTPPAGTTIHDDYERLPNGNTLILCRQTINEPTISDKDVVDDFLVEVNPAGSVVWEWHLNDHFTELGMSQERLDTIYDLGGDWSHVTTAASIPTNTTPLGAAFTPGNIVLGIRNQGAIAIIHRDTDSVVWVLIDAGSRAFYSTHVISGDVPGGGNLLYFDSGFVWEWLPTQGISPPITSIGTARVRELSQVGVAIVFSYSDLDAGLQRGSFSSYVNGGAQRVANGNTLITESQFGRVFEVGTDLKIVWEYVSPHYDGNRSNEIYRAFKVPLDWPPSTQMLYPAPSAGARPDAEPAVEIVKERSER